jgi:hypothetical protein
VAFNEGKFENFVENHSSNKQQKKIHQRLVAVAIRSTAPKRIRKVGAVAIRSTAPKSIRKVGAVAIRSTAPKSTVKVGAVAMRSTAPKSIQKVGAVAMRSTAPKSIPKVGGFKLEAASQVSQIRYEAKEKEAPCSASRIIKQSLWELLLFAVCIFNMIQKLSPYNSSHLECQPILHFSS